MEELFILFGLLIAGALFVIPVWILGLVFRVRHKQDEQATLLFRIRHVQDEQATRADKELQKLQQEFCALHQNLRSSEKEAEATPAPVTPAVAADKPKPVAVEIPPQPVQPVAPPPKPVQAAAPPLRQVKKQPITPPAAPPRQPVRPAAISRTYTPPPPREPTDFERRATVLLRQIWNWIIIGADHRSPDVSYEYALATNWLLRIAVVVFVVGIGFFLKYSIDHGWLGPQGRVAVSVITGILLLAGGLRLMGKHFHLIGQGLLGGGLATLYFSVFAAANMYHLINIYVAFGLMILITFSAGFLAVRLNSLLAALLGIIGGYATPVLLSTGVKNFPGLYGYLVLLGVGVLGIAWYKRWYLLNYLALLGTYSLYFGALHKFYTPADFWQVFPFLAAFFVLFSSVNFVYYFARKQKVTLLELLALLINSGILFGSGYQLITGAYSREWVAALTIILTIFYIAHVYLFLYRGLLDRTLLLTFLALASFFLTMTLPLLLTREWLTLSWSVQALVMLWLGMRLGSSFLRWLAMVIYGIVLFRMGVLDLPDTFSGGHVRTLSTLPLGQYLLQLGERLVMYGVPIASMGCAWKLLRTAPVPAKDTVVPRENDIPALVSGGSVALLMVLIMALVLFVYIQLEFNSFFGTFFDPIRLPSLTLVWIALAVIVLKACHKKAVTLGIVLFMLLCTGMLIKFLVFDLASWGPILKGQHYLGDYSVVDAMMRLLDFGVLILFLVLAGRAFFSAAGPNGKFMERAAAITALVLLFVYLTFETSSILYAYLPGLRAGGVSIVWSLFALGLIGGGIRSNERMLRYTGLILFAVVVWKVFFSDLAQLDQLYRIIAFLVLGVLFLCGSLVYLTYHKKLKGVPAVTETEKKE